MSFTPVFATCSPRAWRRHKSRSAICVALCGTARVGATVPTKMGWQHRTDWFCLTSAEVTARIDFSASRRVHVAWESDVPTPADPPSGHCFHSPCVRSGHLFGRETCGHSGGRGTAYQDWPTIRIPPATSVAVPLSLHARRQSVGVLQSARWIQRSISQAGRQAPMRYATG